MIRVRVQLPNSIHVLSAAVLVSIAVFTSSCVKAPPPHSGSAATKVVEIKSKSGVALVLLPGGEFMMGSDAGGDESPRHRVRVGPFAIDKYEVTQQQFADLEFPDPSHFKGPDHPVEQVRWLDAALFCNARSRAEGLTPCYDEATLECNFDASGYRLPTEAEWEYAARAGTETDYFFGNSPRELVRYACFADDSKQRTDPVGHHRPNPWGICDILGNVAEWCHDVYAADYYQNSPTDNPHGPAKGNKRALRGGSWKSSAEACRVPARQGQIAGFTDACFTGDTLGFRCVRRLSKAEQQQLTKKSSAP